MEQQKVNPILKQIEEILREYKGQDDLKITMQSDFEELQLDSLDTVDLVMEIEDKMGATIELSKDLKTVGDIVKIIEDQKKEGK